jgi:hypothetical protein
LDDDWIIDGHLFDYRIAGASGCENRALDHGYGVFLEKKVDGGDWFLWACVSDEV